MIPLYGSLLFFLLPKNQFRCFVMLSKQATHHVSCCLPGDNVRYGCVFFPPTLLAALTLQVGFLKSYNFFMGFSLNATFEND